MPYKFTTFLLIICCIILAGCRSEHYTAELPDQVDFNFHIRPILSNHCFTCHGPDESGRQAGLRLDTYEGATALLESGRQAINPGHWRSSELIRRIGSDDPETIMPPPEANNPVSERDLALLKKWISQGAEWKDYWAFVAPDKEQYDPQRSIDHFIDRELERRDLAAAPRADKHQLIRRLSYLLTGLPPSPQQINRFVQNEAPDAYEQLVDTLLQSPYFGERWARHWMDLVRYAETMGHEFDYPVIGAWRYRDYLIRAFNQDLPYDELIKEHLAGDLVEPARYDPETGLNESLLATLFYNMSEGKHSPVDIRKEEYDRIANIIDVTSKAFQGLTLACAQCHDHKFDPLPTADYYAMYGIFESSRITYYPANTGLIQAAQIDSIRAHKKAVRELIASAWEPQPQAMVISQQLEPEIPANPELEVLADFRRGDLQGWAVNGDAFSEGNALGSPIFSDSEQKLEGFAEAKASSRVLGTGLQGTLRSPNFTINKNYITIRAAGQNSTVRLVIHNFQLIQDPIHGGLTRELYAPDMQDIVMDVRMWKGSKAYIELLNGKMWKNGQRHDYSVEPDTWLEAEYAFFHDSLNVPPPTLVKPATGILNEQSIQAWIKGEAQPETVTQLNQQLLTGQLPTRYPQAREHHEASRKLNEKAYSFTGFAGMSDGDAVFSPIFVRGNHQQLAEEKQAHRYLTVMAGQIPAFSGEGSDRLQLAEAVAHPANPLTARVMVNRIWHHLFGRGIVETVDNFGLQGKIPSHPALLDHLALRFIDLDWSIKKMIREIVLSEAFQRSTIPSEESTIRDQQNLWLQHFPVRRLEAEAIRDAILATSGRLDLTQFGPPVPAHLTPFMQGRGRPRDSGPLDGAGRRSIYQSVRRNFLSPMMLTFDFPVPFSTFGQRNVSNVPAQSLNLMNDPFVQEQAMRWAESLLTDPGTFADKLSRIYAIAFARQAKAEEQEQAERFFSEQGQLYELSEAEAKLDPQVWADYCQVIYNSKEFIFLL
jgi:hypothetical protein